MEIDMVWKTNCHIEGLNGKKVEMVEEKNEDRYLGVHRACYKRSGMTISPRIGSFNVQTTGRMVE